MKSEYLPIFLFVVLESLLLFVAALLFLEQKLKSFKKFNFSEIDEEIIVRNLVYQEKAISMLSKDLIFISFKDNGYFKSVAVNDGSGPDVFVVKEKYLKLCPNFSALFERAKKEVKIPLKPFARSFAEKNSENNFSFL